jgi:hypothetical protein
MPRPSQVWAALNHAAPLPASQAKRPVAKGPRDEEPRSIDLPTGLGYPGANGTGGQEPEASRPMKTKSPATLPAGNTVNTVLILLKNPHFPTEIWPFLPKMTPTPPPVRLKATYEQRRAFS